MRILVIFLLYISLVCSEGVLDRSECGVTKGCFIPKDPECYQGCNQMAFSYLLVNTTHMKIEITGLALNDTNYYAVGFSDDAMMGNESVIECSSLGSQQYSLKFSYNNPKTADVEPTNIRIPNLDQYLPYFTNTSVVNRDGYIYCSATVYVGGNTNEPRVFKYDYGKQYYLLMAAGPAASDGLRHHIHDVTSQPTNLADVLPNFDPNGCGITKGCYLPLETDCSNGINEMVVSYSLLNNKSLSIEIVGKAPSDTGYYVAVGFSNDQKMGNESVLECSSLGTDQLSFKFSYNPNHTNIRIPGEEQLRSQYSNVISVYQDGNIYCTGVVDISNPKLFQLNLNSPIYLLLASGKTEANGLKHHYTRCIPDTPRLITKVDNAGSDNDECGVGKGCFIPSTCYRGCNGMTFTYKLLPDNQTMFVELTRVSQSYNQYVAVGFSDDNLMGNDSVIECSDMGNGQYSLKFSYNQGGDDMTNLRIPGEENVRGKLISGEVIQFTDGSLYCAGYISLNGDSNYPQIFKYDPKQSYFFLLASGNTTDGKLTHHEHTVVSDLSTTLSEYMIVIPPTFDCNSCTVSKGCFFPQIGGDICDGNGFTYSWIDQSRMEVEFVLNPAMGNGYVAVGFSEDGSMANSSVIECSNLGNEGYSIKYSYNSNSNQRIPGEQDVRNTYITNTTYTQQDGFVYCKGIVKVDGDANYPEIFTYDRSKRYHFILAHGPTNSSGLLYHGSNGRWADVYARDLSKYGNPQKPTDPTPDGSQINCNECGKSMGCYFPDSSNCNGKGVTYKMVGSSSLDVQLTVSNEYKYIALGFSNDDKMGDDNVVECSQLAGQSFSMKFSYNQAGSSPTNVRIPGEQSIESTYFTNVNIVEEDGMIYCSARVNIGGWDNNKEVFKYTPGQKYYLLLAAGLTTNDSLAFHRGNKAVSGSTDISSFKTKTGMSEKTKHNLTIAHAILMILSWCCFVPTALLFARFLRNSWPMTKPCGIHVWFHVHRTFNLVGILLMVASFVCILTANGWKWTGPGSAGSVWGHTHSMTGLLGLILAWMQPFISTMRCSPNAPHRYIFNWIHRGIGVIAYGLATTALSVAAYHFTSLWENPSAQLTLALLPVTTLFVLCITVPMLDYLQAEGRSPSALRNIVLFIGLAILIADSIVLSIMIGTANTN